MNTYIRLQLFFQRETNTPICLIPALLPSSWLTAFTPDFSPACSLRGGTSRDINHSAV
jgi:hypothetical protein